MQMFGLIAGAAGCPAVGKRGIASTPRKLCTRCGSTPSTSVSFIAATHAELNFERHCELLPGSLETSVSRGSCHVCDVPLNAAFRELLLLLLLPAAAFGWLQADCSKLPGDSGKFQGDALLLLATAVLDELAAALDLDLNACTVSRRLAVATVSLGFCAVAVTVEGTVTSLCPLMSTMEGAVTGLWPLVSRAGAAASPWPFVASTR